MSQVLGCILAIGSTDMRSAYTLRLLHLEYSMIFMLQTVTAKPPLFLRCLHFGESSVLSNKV